MTADQLAALADQIDGRLDNENADRQTICEDVAARLRQLAAAAPGLTAQQRDVLVLMAADALEYRVEPVAAKCADCDAHPALLCADHAADLDRAERYRTVLRQLGVTEVTP